MTLRKFYLLLAEWYVEQRINDARTYKLLCAQLTSAPDPGAIFPLLKNTNDSSDDDEEDVDDDISFQQVAAALIPNQD